MFRDTIIIPLALYLPLRLFVWFDLPVQLSWAGLTAHFDLLSMPVVLGLALWGTRRITGRPNLFLPESMAWLTYVVVAFVFEVYLPGRSAIYTADVLDVLAYMLGTKYFIWRQSQHQDYFLTG